MKLFDDLRNRLYSESPESRERVQEKNKVVEKLGEFETDQLTLDPCVERTWKDAAKEYNDRIKKAYQNPGPVPVYPNSDLEFYTRREMRL